MQIAYREGDRKASAEVLENALDGARSVGCNLGRGRDAVDFQGYQGARSDLSLRTRGGRELPS
jgi:hypothetical protein